VLSTASLDRFQRRRAFAILAVLTNAYVWASSNDSIASQRIPPAIASPFLEVAGTCGLNPVVSHAAVVLFNWKRIDPRGPLNLDNIQSVNLFTGSMDEAWFYLVTVAIELAAVPAIRAIVAAFAAVERKDSAALLAELEVVSGA